MAKVSFTKLGLKKEEEIEILEWNDQKIEIKQYLPIEDKLNLVASIILESVDLSEMYINPGKIYVYTILETILAYTNISLTEKQKEDVAKIYDLIVSSGLSTKIFEYINPYEYKQICDWVNSVIEDIVKYKNSALGILSTIKEQYDEEDFNIDQMQEKLTQNKEELAFLKDVMDKLG